MIELSNESVQSLKSIIKQCGNGGIFISENGLFRAISDSRTVIAQGCLPQKFRNAAHYNGYLVDKSGELEGDESELRFLKPSGRNSFFKKSISDIASNIEAKDAKISRFVLRNALYRFFENVKIGLPSFSFELRNTDEDLDFSIIFDGAPQHTIYKDQVFIHAFEGPECSVHLLGSCGILNGIRRLKNEEFDVTVFHGGVILLESTVRDLTVLQSAKIML